MLLILLRIRRQPKKCFIKHRGAEGPETRGEGMAPDDQKDAGEGG